MSRAEALQFVGYQDTVRNAIGSREGQVKLTVPSQNVRLTRDGKVFTRGGYSDTSVDLGEGNNLSRGWRMEQFDLTFFAVDTSIYYIEGEITPSSTLIDTGITITSGQAKNTGFLEFSGCMITSNKTDGSYLILVTRLNGAASATDSSLVCDRDGVSTTSIFNTALSISNFDVRIAGTNEAATGTNLGASTFTGMNLSQAYADNTIAIVIFDLTDHYPKCRKIVEWENMLHFIDVNVDDDKFSSDINASVIPYTPPATGTAMENMLTVSSSNVEVFGKPGRIVNALSVQDYMYVWTDNATGFTSVEKLNRSTNAHPIEVFEGEGYGCVNADCAIDMGNGTVPFVTPDNRIIAIRTTTQDGAPKLFPDESFDDDVINTVGSFDDDKSNFIAFYHSGEKIGYFQVQIDGVIFHIPYNNKKPNAWLPPDNDKVFGSMFERNGILFATELTSDTIYQLNVGTEDDGIPISCFMAHGLVDYGETTEIKTVDLWGEITQNTDITVETFVNDNDSNPKTITSDDYSFDSGKSFSDVVIGDLVVGGSALNIDASEYDETIGVSPDTYGKRFQTVLSSSGAFTWAGYRINATPNSDSFQTIK